MRVPQILSNDLNIGGTSLWDVHKKREREQRSISAKVFWQAQAIIWKQSKKNEFRRKKR